MFDMHTSRWKLFEATVQLRSSARRLSEEEFQTLRATLNDVLEEMPEDPMFFITNEGPVTGGYDVVLGSKALCKSMGTTFNLRTWRPNYKLQPLWLGERMV